MSTRLTPEEVLQNHSLEVRCKLLEIAAIYDRYQRAGGEQPTASDDPRLARCTRALKLLSEYQEKPDRAEQIALMFSDPA